MKKKILFALCLTVVLTALLAISVSAMELREIWDISKTERDSVRAFIYENENSYYSLDIIGTGQMKDWDGAKRSPWSSYYGSKIMSVTIEEGVTNIGEAAFSGCSFLKIVKLPQSIIDIGNIAFLNCVSLENLEIPTNVVTIGEATFQNCDSLASITIPISVKTIKKYAFCTCDKLTEISISDEVTIIEDWAFSNCTNLIKVKMGKNLEELGEGCFFGCVNLSSIELPKCVNLKCRVFGECYSLNIYSELENQPSGWDNEWNPENCPVIWNYKNTVKNDVFTFKGYSFGMLGQISFGFDIDYEAKALYEELTGDTLEMGVVFAGYDNLGGAQPLDENSKETKLDVGRVIKVDLTSYNYQSYDFALFDITDSLSDVKLVIAAYTYDGECVKYVQENGIGDTVTGISYNEAKESVAK